jgi:hypothetical protein
MQMEMFTMETGKTIKRRDKVLTLMQMELFTKVSGLMINSTVKG